MIDAELQELEALCEKATPGPWSRHGFGPKVKGPSNHVAQGMGPLNERMHNAAFISAARTAVPALIAEVRRLRTENESLRDAIGKPIEPCP